jgi:Ca2+-binding RTX toxin-like protein
MATLVGSNDNETLIGGIESDVIYGYGGGDRLSGGAGNDLLDGGDGDDYLDGESGTDTLLGGVGNDYLTSSNSSSLSGGNDYLNGGDGNDQIRVSRVGTNSDIVGAYGGAGDDSFSLQVYSGLVLAYGDDGVDTFDFIAGATATGGAGIDQYTINNLFSFSNMNGSIIITDFQVGLGGEVINLGGAIGQLTNWNGGNPFSSGHLRLTQVGADTRLEVDQNGGADGWQSLVVFKNTSASSFAAVNLGGNFNDSFTGTLGNDSLIGFLGDDKMFGLGGSDTLVGGNGNDTLDGGLGVDSLNGGLGNDVYYLDSSLDVLVELPLEGNDIAFSSVNYTLGAGIALEILAAANGASTMGLSLSGNEFANQISGTAGGDTLSGGAAADTLYGFGGNDYYYVDNAGDFVVEGVGNGFDVVFTSASFTATGGSEIEVIAAANAAWITGTALTGNELANQLLGSAGADTLAGGLGADTLYGFGGNDFYYVDSASDVIIEAVGGGTDVVYTTAFLTLVAGAEIEVLAIANANTTTSLYLAGNEFGNQILAGAGGDGLYGFGGNDTIYGYAGNDFLSGGTGNDYLFGGDSADTLQGGDGADWLIGGAGADVFKFTAASESLLLSRDVVSDFATGTDKLDFSSFAGTSGPFTIGTLTPGGGPRLEIGTNSADGYFHVLGDFNGDGIADFELLVASNGGASQPVAGDFIL